jgi:FkbM family methyltransferase
MKSFIIRTLHSIFGYRKYLYVFSTCKISTLWLFRKKWDYLYFVHHLKPEANIVIIGASTGITTIPIAKKCNKGKVFAYEPIQDNFDTIKKLIRYYKLNNCTAYNIALGDISANSKSMLIPIVKGVIKQGMAHMDVESIKKYDKYIIVQVEVTTLDDREEIQNMQIDGLKLIAENYEYEILKGAEKTIKRSKPVIYCELWDNQKRNEVIHLIESFGYRSFYRAYGELKTVDINQYRNRNLFFIPINE